MKVIWIGEDHLHGDQAGPSFTTWGGVKFPKGEAVEVTDEYMIAKARGNQFFKVEETNEPVKRGPGRPPKVKTDDDQDQG